MPAKTSRPMICLFILWEERRSGMNSSELPGTKRTGLLGQARASFDWVELLAVPVAICVMETQPIVLVLAFGATAFLGDTNAVPLSEGSITLLLLGLHWWARAVSALTQGRSSRTRVRLLQLLGLCLAIAITVVTHISLLNNIPALLFSIVLIVGFWSAGMYRVQTGPSDDYVLTSFKIGLGVLLGILMPTRCAPSRGASRGSFESKGNLSSV